MLNQLKGSCNARRGNFMRLDIGNVPAVEMNFARFGAVNARYEIEKSGFPGAVRADQAVNGFVLHIEIDIVDRLEAAETLGESSYLQQDGHYSVSPTSARFRSAVASRAATNRRVAK